MKHLYSIFVLLCLFFSSDSFGQSIDKNNDQVSKNESKNIKELELYMQNTDFSIIAGKKHVLSLKRTDLNADLENTIALRAYSLKLYESGNIHEALICSSKARQIAVMLLTSLKGIDYAKPYNTFENEEVQLAKIKKDDSAIEKWIKEAKQ